MEDECEGGVITRVYAQPVLVVSSGHPQTGHTTVKEAQKLLFECTKK